MQGKEGRAGKGKGGKGGKGPKKLSALQLILLVASLPSFYNFAWTQTQNVTSVRTIGGDLAPSLGGGIFVRRTKFVNDLFLVVDHIFQIFPVFTVCEM